MRSFFNQEATLLVALLIISVKLGVVFTTDRPIIGIVFHEITSERLKNLSPNSTSYVASSYVKAVEASGARVAVLRLGQNESYYRDMLRQINGLLIPGGDADFDTPNGYAAATKILYEEAIKLNDKNDNMPVLGICLGFEILMHLSNKGKELRARCKSSNVALPLLFEPDFQDSNLFRDADPNILQILSTQPVTSNYHNYCVTEKNFTKLGLQKQWKILSTNVDENGLDFISTVESRRYPIVGLQFHPEKNAYEWNKSQNNPHIPEAIYSARHFFDWLIKEARKSNHSFDTAEEEFNALIDNIKPTYTAPLNRTFEEVYLLQEV